jgi:hypothetical protein
VLGGPSARFLDGDVAHAAIIAMVSNKIARMRSAYHVAR